MNQMKDEEMIKIQNLLELRMFAYDILRRTFLQEPTKELIKQFQNGIINFFPFKDESVQLREGISGVNQYFKNFKMEENFEDLHWDYTRMFIGPYELPAPMWESSYVNRDGLLFQEETWKVRRLYLVHNLESIQYGREADDHLGLELDFMYQLSKTARDVIDEGDMSQLYSILESQKYFLNHHLLNWTPAFARKVAKHANTDFYKEIVKVLVGYLNVDKACLEEMTSQKMV